MPQKLRSKVLILRQTENVFFFAKINEVLFVGRGSLSPLPLAHPELCWPVSSRCLLWICPCALDFFASCTWGSRPSILAELWEEAVLWTSSGFSLDDVAGCVLWALDLSMKKMCLCPQGHVSVLVVDCTWRLPWEPHLCPDEGHERVSVEKLRQQTPVPELERQALAVLLAFSSSRKAAAVQEVKALVCFPCPFSFKMS